MRLSLMLILCLNILSPEQIKGQDIKITGHEVVISSNAIGMPIGKMILIRKNSRYCAVKFTEAKKGKGKNEWYVKYESHFQGDGTGNFNSKSVKSIKNELADLQPLSIIGRLAVARGNTHIDCIDIMLDWSGTDKISWVYFNNGIEMAPSKWADILEVNVSDQRLKWYRYDERRKDILIPIDKLW
jgi:hypothetical protein